MTRINMRLNKLRRLHITYIYIHYEYNSIAKTDMSNYMGSGQLGGVCYVTVYQRKINYKYFKMHLLYVL